MKNVTIKTVEEFINPDLATPNLKPELHNKIMDTTAELTQKGNYENRFEKTSHYWSKSNWRVLAADVARKINEKI